MEKKTAAINVTKALASVSFSVLAAISGASGNLLFAGLASVPAALLSNSETIGTLLRKTHVKSEVFLDIPAPKVWSGSVQSWQDICTGVEKKLPFVLQNLSQRLQTIQSPPTTQTIRSLFIEELTRQIPQWDVTSQERGLIAHYLATPLLEKMTETLKSVIAPVQTDAILTTSQISATNTTEILALLSQITELLDKMRMNTQTFGSNPIASTSTSTNSVMGASTDIEKTLQQKLDTGAYDVFICYNETDIDGVRPIGKELLAQGILPWFDEVDLRPGTPWMAQQEEQILKIASAAVFVGKSGIAPWQQMQVYTFLEQFILRRCPVIPVILADAAMKPPLPPFLRNMAWVNFDKSEPDPMGQLIWGITGKRPAVRQ